MNALKVLIRVPSEAAPIHLGVTTAHVKLVMNWILMESLASVSVYSLIAHTMYIP